MRLKTDLGLQGLMKNLSPHSLLRCECLSSIFNYLNNESDKTSNDEKGVPKRHSKGLIEIKFKFNSHTVKVLEFNSRPYNQEIKLEYIYISLCDLIKIFLH